MARQAQSQNEQNTASGGMTSVYPLTTVPFIMVLGNSMLIPVLPAIQKAVHINLFHAGLLITFFSIPAGLMIPLAGIISDQIGRKKVMGPALLIYGAGGILAGIAAVVFHRPYLYLLGARIIQGIGAGGTYQLAMALAGDLIQGKQRAQALGVLEAANGLGKVVSPLAGAAVALISWYAPFFVYGILAFPVAAIIYLMAKEPQNKKKAQTAAEYIKGLQNVWNRKGPSLLGAFLAGAVVLFSLFGLLSFLSDQLEKAKFGVFARGWIIAVPVLFMTITAYVLGTILKQYLTKILKVTAVSGLAAAAVSLAAYTLLTSTFLQVAAASLLGIGAGMVLPSINLLITSAASAGERGLITCLYGTVRFFGVAVGPPVFGLAGKIGLLTIFAGSAALAVLTALAAGFFIKVKQVLPPEMTGGAGERSGKPGGKTG